MKKIALLFVAVLLLAGCKTRTVVITVPEVRTDTLVITKHQRDSIWLHDSIFVKEKQKDDTVWIEVQKWHTKYVDRSTHDTIYVATHDSIPTPYPVTEYVEKKLKWWQKSLMYSGSIALMILLVWIVWQIAKFKMKRF